jgi:hypothetical protein
VAVTGAVVPQIPVKNLEQDPSAADEPPVNVLDLTIFAVVLSLQATNP